MNIMMSNILKIFNSMKENTRLTAERIKKTILITWH